MNVRFAAVILSAMVGTPSARVGDSSRRRVSGCNQAWGRCGGHGWNGPTCCVAGYTCVEDSEWSSMCRPAPADEGCLDAWAKCGGIGHNGHGCCTSGYTCVEVDPWYSQCRPSSGPRQCHCNQSGNHPATDAPTTDAPTTAPPTGSPTTESPTSSPTTASPTSAPTTESPTSAPTTESPTSAPTTESPTSDPTTESPTAIPTTASPSAAPTTGTPTGAPTRARSFGEMKTCVVTGDPHFTMFSGGTHDFMGPTSVQQSQHYYAAPCDGPSIKDPPFRILGAHYNGNNQGAGLDLLALELEDTDDGSIYYVWMSSAVHAIGYGSQLSYDYDSNNPGDLVDLTSNTMTSLGSRFQILYIQQQPNRQASFTLLVDGNKVVDVFMMGQTNYVGGRYRQHTARILVDTAYEEELCGLCGPMDTSASSFLACSGYALDLPSEGINSNNFQTFADQDGWTYERDFYHNSCGTYYDIDDNAPSDAVYPKECDAAISADVEQACQAAKAAAESSSSCNGDLATFCTDLVSWCSIDACVAADGDITAIDDAVQVSYTDVINYMNQFQ